MANDPEYEQLINSCSGFLPKCQAGNATEAKVDLPCRGGINNISLGDF